MTSNDIQLEICGDHHEVAVIRLTRPAKRNALNDALVLAIRDTFDGLPASVRAAVITGDGDHFCAGLDLSELKERDAGQGLHHSRMWHAALERVQYGPVPVIAALHGAVVGGGLNWPGLAAAPEDGGQDLPAALEAVLYEMLSAANHGWTMAPGLLHGAYECLRHHASDALKAAYLEKLATGQWLATMCLTEPHAGSDLGLVRTKAVPQPDGSYQISGTKIFISGGEHDLSDNIVHLVLARLPDAPPGPKGLSLFLVPKFYADGARSAVHCERIEEKMGLHGSPTCVMRFDAATGWIIGEPGRGLNAA